MIIHLPQIRVAEFLLDKGANSALADHEGLTAFDLALMDKQTTLDLNPLSSPSDVYAWGANANFNLGIRDEIQHRWETKLAWPSALKPLTILLVTL